MADYIPEQDITRTLTDGRTVLVAAAGVPVPEAQAKELGLVKDAQPQGPSETKVEQPTEMKSEPETLGTEDSGEPLPVGKQAKASK